MLGRDSFKGMGVDFGDLNGDGLLDIFVSNIAAEFALLESHFVFLSTGETDADAARGSPRTSTGASRSGCRGAAGAGTRKLADFDNDGVLEALQARRVRQGDDQPLARAAGAGDGQRRVPERSRRAGPGSGRATT